MTFDEWLQSTLEMQRDTYGHDLPMQPNPADHSYTDEQIQYVKDNVFAAQDEFFEAMKEVGWKPWAHGPRLIDREKFVGELVDVQHFLANLYVAVGVTGAELTAKYQAKQHRNKQRQIEGYDGKDKCKVCGRAFDDPGVKCAPGYCAGSSYASEPHNSSAPSIQTDES